MKRFFLTAITIAMTAAMSQAGPLGLFGRCRGGSRQAAETAQPGRQVVRTTIEQAPARAAIAKTISLPSRVIEARPLYTAYQLCVGGVCGK